MRIPVTRVALFVVAAASCLACRPKGGSELLDTNDVVEVLTPDNIYQVMQFASGTHYNGYIKASYPVAADGAVAKQWFQPQDYKFHADFLKTMPVLSFVSRVGRRSAKVAAQFPGQSARRPP